MFAKKLQDFIEELKKNNEIHRTEIECARLEDVPDKIRFVESLMGKYREAFEREIKVHEEKSDEKSLCFRLQGNNFHKSGKFVEAMASYNKSICFAVSIENVVIGYSNRSATLFEMGRFEDCEENICLALACAVLPDHLKGKLNKRLKQCKEKKWGPGKEGDRELDLSYIPHPKIPFIVNRLDMKENFLYAKEHIEKNKVVVKEKALAFTHLPEGIYLICTFCLTACANLIPCPNCAHAMFCSEKCMKEAYAEFHKWECSNIDLLFLFGPNLRMAFQMIMKTSHSLKGFENFKKYMEEESRECMKWYNVDPANFCRKEHFFKFIHSSFDKTLCSPREQLVIVCGAVLFSQEVLKNQEMEKIFRTDEQKMFFSELVYHNTSALYHMDSHVIIGEDALNFDVIHSKVYPLVDDALKTSNAPNVYMKWENCHLHYITTRPIKKGEYLQVAPKRK